MPGEDWTLESGATATWTTNALAAGTYTVYADYSLTDPNGNTQSADQCRTVHDHLSRRLDSLLRSTRTPPSTANSIWAHHDHRRGPGSSSARAPPSDGRRQWTIANQVEFVNVGRRICKVGSPALNSFATQSGITTLAPGGLRRPGERLRGIRFPLPHRRQQHPGGRQLHRAIRQRRANWSRSVQVGRRGPDDRLHPPITRPIVSITATPPLGRPKRPAAARRWFASALADYGNDPDNWIGEQHRRHAGRGQHGHRSAAADRADKPGRDRVAQSRIRLRSLGPRRPTPRSDVDHYVIYRNGLSIGTSHDARPSPTRRSRPATNYTYTVSAVNRDGIGQRAVGVDRRGSLPGVASYDWIDNQRHRDLFQRAADGGSRLDVSNYCDQRRNHVHRRRGFARQHESDAHDQPARRRRTTPTRSR